MTLKQRVSRVQYPFDDYDLAQMRSAYTAVRFVFAQYGIEEYECEPLLSVADDVGGSPDVVGAGPGYALIAALLNLAVALSIRSITHSSSFTTGWPPQDPQLSDLVHARPLVGAIIQPACQRNRRSYEVQRRGSARV
jgi:hypothetical protein